MSSNNTIDIDMANFQPDDDARASVLGWMIAFARCVRDVDYASAKPMVHPDVIAFGTHNDVITGLDNWISTQWDNVWPNTTDFEFVVASTHILLTLDHQQAVVIAPWTSTGYHTDGRSFDRPGRATMVLARSDDSWICIHSHMSLNRGVPQTSHLPQTDC